MFSTRKNFGGEKNLEKESERKDLTLNLAVCGSPVPMHHRQPNIMRECKVYKSAPKESKRKDIPFPVDNIIYLTQKLELTSLTAKKIENISLSALNIAADKSLEEVEKNVFCSRECGRKEDNPSLEVLSPNFDFSLDLSSIVNTANESDENGADLEEEEKASFHYNGKTFNAQTTRKELPENSRFMQGTNPSSSKSNKILDFLLRDQSKKPNPSSCDLINAYINSVKNEQDLIKYFRPCYTCKELYCICPDSSFRTDLCPVEDAVKDYLEKARDPPCGFDKTNKKDGIDVCDARFACESCCSFLKKRFCCSEFCCQRTFETDLYAPFGEGKCKFRSDPVSQRASDDFVSSDRILAYTSSLANAAKSARVLARDLELILSSLNGETE